LSDAFAPPEAQPADTSGPLIVDAPGVAGVLTVTAPTMFGASRLLLDGEPLSPSWLGKFTVPMADGSEVTAQFQAALTDSIPSLGVDGVTYKFGEPIPMALAVMSFLPLVLIFVGGAVGGGIGAVGWITNRKISLLKVHWAARAVGILAATGATFGLYLAIAMALAIAIHGV